jgi:glycosyltransferase involved in cell wall biosynthesis
MNKSALKKVCMVVHSFYPDDPRVRREAEALLDAGWVVDVICLRGPGDRPTESQGRSRIYRLPVGRNRGGGISSYLTEYGKFFVLASARLATLHLRRHYDLVQVHNMPDFLVFTALVPKLMGAHVILDIHDLVPELYTQKFSGKQDHPFVRITQWAERRSAAFAHHVITVGEPFRRKLVARSVSPEKLTIIMNAADTKLFRPVVPEPQQHQNGTFTLMYHGGTFDRYGLDIAVRAVGQLRHQIPGLQFRVIGTGDAIESLRRLVDELKLQDIVQFSGFISLDQMPAHVASADLGVVPYRHNPFTDLLYPTKAFEYIVMGVPVIMSRIPAMAELFGDIPDMFFKTEDVEDLAVHLFSLYQSPERRRRLLEAECRAYIPYAWDAQRRKYLSLVQQLTAGHAV